MARVLVTGASGFIGMHLVRHLKQYGDQVVCLVRPDSDRVNIEPWTDQFVVGDLSDPVSLAEALPGVDVVYHLAGRTTAFHRRQFQEVNVDGVYNLVSACVQQSAPPRFVLVSSLAAAGPAVDGKPRIESDPVRQVSQYGRSKWEGEKVLRRFADRLSATIVRPPIVIGEGDAHGFLMFESIVRHRLHATPGAGTDSYSLIAAPDLAMALRNAAELGSSISTDPLDEEGVYFVADPQRVSYRELGRRIGNAVQCTNVRVFPVPRPALWVVAAGNELWGRLRGRLPILNFDKVREATAGSWICAGDKLSRETGFRPAATLQQRLNATADWYFEQGWLTRPPKPVQPIGTPLAAKSRSTPGHRSLTS